MEQRIVEVLEEITRALRLLEEAIPSDYSSPPGSMHRRTMRELGECLDDIDIRVKTIKVVMKTF